MDVLRQAIYDKINGTAAITSILTTYRTVPAVVDGFSIPDDMDTPLIYYNIVADTNNDSKNTTGREVLVDLHCITSAESDPATLATAVRNAFHRTAITVTGWTNIITECTGPVQGETDTNYKELIVSIRFVLEAN
jgi:hypothetical protein